MDFFSFLTGTPKSKPTKLPLAKETGLLLAEIQNKAKEFEKNVEVAKLHMAAKEAMLKFKGVDCSGKGMITDLKVGPAELIAMSRNAVNMMTKPLRKVYLSVNAKGVERTIEGLIDEMNELIRVLRELGRKKDKDSMLGMVCFLQASINKLKDASEATARELGKVSCLVALTKEAQDILNEVQLEHDFDMLDDLLTEAKLKDIPNAPTTKPRSRTSKRGGKTRKAAMPHKYDKKLYRTRRRQVLTSA